MKKINMKPIFASALLLAFATTSFAQQTSVVTPSHTSIDYLQKSKKQRKLGTTLLTIGSGLIVSSLFIPRKKKEPEGFCIAFCDLHKKSDIKTGIFIGGIVVSLSSIPLFTLAVNNRKKANSTAIFLNMEKTSIIQYAAISKKSFPVLSLKINL